MAILTRDKIIDAWTRLGELAHAEGKGRSISSWSVERSWPETRRWAQTVADELDLPSDWLNDGATRYREQQRKPLGPTSITTPTLAKRVVAAPVAPVPATSSQPTPASGPELTPSASSPIPAAVPEVPAWAITIADELFRKALLHIEKHGSIDEAELTSLVGGPRRARMFARDLDTWRATLPFGVEVSTARGIKIYRRVTVG